LPAYEDGTKYSEMSAYKIQMPGNCPEEDIQHTEHGESLKSRICSFAMYYYYHPGESNGNLPLRTCPGCSVPEPYRSPGWVLVPAKLA
jgi:hypothetical protein